MKKRFLTAFAIVMFSIVLFLPAMVSAETPEIMRSLRSHIQTYGALKNNVRSGSDSYTSKISYQKSKKRFLFECSYSNGNSNSSVKMYMPVSKKMASYSVYFSETVRAAGKTAKISGKATLKRKSYSDQSTNLKFSRKNGTSVSKKITNSAYQAAANSLLKVAFKLWENSLESKVTICFRNFGFRSVTVIDYSKVNTYEW
jgi:hypothetical protein